MTGFDDIDKTMQPPAGLKSVRDTLSQAVDVEPTSRGGQVTPMRADASKLKPRAKALLGSVVWAQEIAAVIDHPYLVKGWFDRAGLSVLFGRSNTGKSFLAMDIAHHVAKGSYWAGRRVRRGRVLYVAAEGGGTFSNRVAALDAPEFWVLPVPLTLTGKESASAAVAEMLQHLAATGGSFDLIIVDTMARVMGGGDENAAPDIADLVRNLDHIRRATGAHIMLVHHTGKDSARGARGHSSLRAAIDTEIELSRDEETGLITAETTKQRDGPTGYKFSYRLRQVEIGRDQDGDPVTTCLVEPADPAQAGRAVLSEAAQRALGLLEQALAEGGEIIRRPSYPGTPCVAVHVWRDACCEPGSVSTAGDKDARARQFRKVRDQLIDAKQVLLRDDLVWRVQS